MSIQLTLLQAANPIIRSTTNVIRRFTPNTKKWPATYRM